MIGVGVPSSEFNEIKGLKGSQRRRWGSIFDQHSQPKVALVACMRKLIVILNTMIKRRQKWDPSRYALR